MKSVSENLEMTDEIRKKWVTLKMGLLDLFIEYYDGMSAWGVRKDIRVARRRRLRVT